MSFPLLSFPHFKLFWSMLPTNNKHQTPLDQLYSNFFILHYKVCFRNSSVSNEIHCFHSCLPFQYLDVSCRIVQDHLTSISGSFRESKYSKWSVRIDFDQCYVIDVLMSGDGLTDLGDQSISSIQKH